MVFDDRFIVRLMLELARDQLFFLHQSEVRIMSAIDDAVSRLEASNAAALATLSALIADATVEIQQLAAEVAGSGNQALADRLNAVSDALDKGNADATAEDAALKADDPAAPAPPAPAPTP